MGEVRIWMPDSGVIVDYASQTERDRSVRLARERQGLAQRGCLLPGWDELTEAEREMASLEARNWLRAAVLAGLTEPEPEREAGR
jgi:hypothetical protein